MNRSPSTPSRNSRRTLTMNSLSPSTPTSTGPVTNRSSTKRRSFHRSPEIPGSPGSPVVRRMSIRNSRNNSKNEPYDVLLTKTIPEDCKWWNDFAIKISNLSRLLNQYQKRSENNYVIVGSSANALLTYFYRPDLLSTLSAPNDGDIIIIPVANENNNRRSRKASSVLKFRTEGVESIGTYKLKSNQYDEQSGTFEKVMTTPNTFDSFDVILESSCEYISIDDFNILEPNKLFSTYKEHGDLESRKEKNAPKIKVLEQVLIEYNKNPLKTNKFTKIKSKNNNRIGNFPISRRGKLSLFENTNATNTNAPVNSSLRKLAF